MNKYLKVILVILLSVFLIVIFTPIFGVLYEMVFGSLNSVGVLSVGTGGVLRFIIGSFISYILFIPIIVTIFTVKPVKYYLIITLIGLPLLFILLNSNILMGIQIVIPFILIAVVGWLIGEGILLLYKKFKK